MNVQKKNSKAVRIPLMIFAAILILGNAAGLVLLFYDLFYDILKSIEEEIQNLPRLPI